MHMNGWSCIFVKSQCEKYNMYHMLGKKYDSNSILQFRPHFYLFKQRTQNSISTNGSVKSYQLLHQYLRALFFINWQVTFLKLPDVTVTKSELNLGYYLYDVWRWCRTRTVIYSRKPRLRLYCDSEEWQTGIRCIKNATMWISWCLKLH